MKTTKFLMLLIGMISFISPYQGGAQNPWNYQKTIRVTDELVEVFEGDGMTILLSSYTGPVKGSDLYANPRNPGWDLLRNRFSAKNGQTFWIDMNTIQGLTEIYELGGSDPATLHPNNMIEVWGAGTVGFYYKALVNGEVRSYFSLNHINHFGVTQWAGADLPSSTILVVEEGSELSGTLSEEGFLYLAESEVIGVEEWPTYGMWWYDYNLSSPANSILLFEYLHTVSIGELLNAAIPNSKYGDSFLMYVGFDDGTSNGSQYCSNHELFTIKDYRTVAVTGIQLNKTELTLIRLKSEQLVATVLPSNATNRKVGWYSSNPEIASVDENGFVTAHEAGEAIITATTEDGGFTESCVVTVTFNTAVEEVGGPEVQILGNLLRISGSSGLLEIYDLSGRMILSEQVTETYKKMLHFSPGLYVVRMGGWSQKIWLR